MTCPRGCLDLITITPPEDHLAGENLTKVPPRIPKENSGSGNNIHRLAVEMLVPLSLTTYLPQEEFKSDYQPTAQLYPQDDIAGANLSKVSPACAKAGLGLGENIRCGSGW